MRKYSRRDFVAAAAAAAPVVAAGLPSAFAQSSNPIRIGVSAPLSGPAGNIGVGMRLGAEIAAAEINKAGGIRGRPLELVIRDDRQNVNEVVSVARDLAGQGINLLVGGVSSGGALATLPVAKQNDLLYIVTAAISMRVTHDEFIPNVFRNNDNDHQQVRALARLAADRYSHITNWGYMGYDQPAFLASYEQFKRALTEFYEAKGLKPNFADPLLTKPGAGDFKNQIVSLANSNIEGLWNLVYGSDSITFYQQAKPFGLSSKLKAILDRGNEFPFVKALKQNTPNNFWTVMPWYFGARNLPPMNDSFLKEYQARTRDSYPDGFHYYGHAPIRILAAAIEAADGATDTATLIKVLESGRKFDTIKGPVHFRKEDHQAVGSIELVGFNPSDKQPGFEVFDSLSLAGDTVLEPASPGKAFTP